MIGNPGRITGETSSASRLIYSRLIYKGKSQELSEILQIYRYRRIALVVMTFTPTLSQSALVDNEPGYGQLFAVLLRRKLWVIGAILLAMGFAYYKTSKELPTFASSMQLLVEPNYQSRSQGPGDSFVDSNVQVDYATQLNLLQSSDLSQEAMRLLQKEYPEFDPNSPMGVAYFRSGLSVGQISGGSKKQTVETKIFGVNYTANNPEKTQKVLQVLAQVYRQYNRKQQELRLEKGRDAVAENLRKVRQEVKELEATLEQFRRTTGMVNPDDQSRFLTEQANRNQQELQVLDAQIGELKTRYAGLQAQLAMPDAQALLASRISQSPRYQAGLSQLQKTELELAQLRAKYQDGTDQVRQLLQQRENELGVLRVELSRVLGQSASGIGSEQLQGLGRLSATEVSLVNSLVETDLNLQAALVRRASLGQAYVEARTQLKEFPKLLSKYGSLQPDIVAKRETLQQLLKAQQDIEIELARQGFEWQVIEQPQLGVRLGPDLKKNLLLGMVAGAMLGGMAAFAREAMDDSVHTSEELQKQAAAPLLGVVPEVKGLSGDEEPLFALPFQKQRALPSSVSEMMQWHDFREALDLLYQNMQLLQGDTPLKSLVVTSALAGEGKSTIALGLAMSAARLHQRVLLIDADLRNPTLHTRLGLPNDKGLSNFLVERGMVPQELLGFAEGDRTGISVLTSGPVVGDPAKLLSSQRLRDVMAKFEENYDLVIVDTSPVLGMVDTLLTASCCQGTLLVGKVDRVKKADLTAAMANLRALNLMGMVANGVPSGRKAYAGSIS